MTTICVGDLPLSHPGPLWYYNFCVNVRQVGNRMTVELLWQQKINFHVTAGAVWHCFVEECSGLKAAKNTHLRQRFGGKMLWPYKKIKIKKSNSWSQFCMIIVSDVLLSCLFTLYTSPSWLRWIQVRTSVCFPKLNKHVVSRQSGKHIGWTDSGFGLVISGRS